MAKYKITFIGSDNSKDHKLECFYNTKNEIYISIDSGLNQISDWITLDKETAIKLVRVLKREISKIRPI